MGFPAQIPQYLIKSPEVKLIKSNPTVQNFAVFLVALFRGMFCQQSRLQLKGFTFDRAAIARSASEDELSKDITLDLVIFYITRPRGGNGFKQEGRTLGLTA